MTILCSTTDCVYELYQNVLLLSFSLSSMSSKEPYKRFDQTEQQSLGRIAIKTLFGEIEDFDDFLVIDVDVAYNALLERLLMHKLAAIPFMYHQCMKYLLRGE